MVEFELGGGTTGYLAAPEGQRGPGVIVLHAWWGLTPFFESVCDRLAEAGFVAVAPDLHDGRTASSIEEAEELVSRGDHEEIEARVLGALEHLQRHPAVRGDLIGAVGFSFGGAWALYLSTLEPEAIAAVAVYYGNGDADFSKARAAYLGHFAEHDEWEPTEYVRQTEAALRAAGREVTFHTYTGVGHWFFEEDRPGHYDGEAARLAWERTVDFLWKRLGQHPENLE